MYILGDPNGRFINVFDNDERSLIPANAIAQASDLLDLDVVVGAALMPDAHVGVGATIGSVIATRGAVLPSAAGVDIFCGVHYVPLGSLITREMFERRPNFKSEIYRALSAAIPAGFPCAWPEREIPSDVHRVWEDRLRFGYEEMVNKYPALPGKNDANQLGTLGGGNHFVEVGFDDRDQSYLLIHSGSRGIGNRIGTFFIREAAAACRERNLQIPNRDLAYLLEDDGRYHDYLRYMAWSGKYARFSRELMRHHALIALIDLTGVPRFFDYDPEVPYAEDEFDCHHNYLAIENHNGRVLCITRKGAVGARLGEPAVIPGSMGARSYLVRGLGNPASYFSSSHGAGRSMSRTEAKNKITPEEHARALAVAGVECDHSENTLDESPGAYKDIDAVMAAQADLTASFGVLKQVVCLKGLEDKGRNWNRRRAQNR